MSGLFTSKNDEESRRKKHNPSRGDNEKMKTVLKNNHFISYNDVCGFYDRRRNILIKNQNKKNPNTT